MRAWNALLRTFASAYHFGVGVFLAGLAAVAYVGGVHNINTGGMTAAAGASLSRDLLLIGCGGILLSILALLGRFRWLFSLYCALAAVTMFRWFFASSYKFSSDTDFRWAIYLFAGAVGALLCSLIPRHRQKNHRSRSR